MNLKLIFTLVLLLLVVLFSIQNFAVVEIKFLLWSFEMSRALLYFLIFAVGLISGWMVNNYMKYKK